MCSRTGCALILFSHVTTPHDILGNATGQIPSHTTGDQAMSSNTLTITDVKTTAIEAPWGQWTRRWLLIRVETAEGLHGYGDTWASPQTNAAVMELRDLLIGKDPTNVEALHRSMVPTAYAVFAGSHVNSGQRGARRKRHRDGPLGPGGQGSRRACVQAARRQAQGQGKTLLLCRRGSTHTWISRTSMPRWASRS